MNTERTISEITSGLHSGSFSVAELVEKSIEKAEQYTEYNAFTSIHKDAALEQARIVDEKRKRGEPMHDLAGVPCAVKDLLCTKGIPTTAASGMLREFVPPYDAEAVAQLKEKDVIIIGKTNMDEFGMGSSSEFSAFGAVRNPHDMERVAGGSSGGSAVAVAAGIVPFALGTDTGGSIRQPAAFCGVVGFKPTYGRVSRYGVIAYASSFDQVGPIANTVEDAALVYEAIAGHDAKDATTSRENVIPTHSSLSEGVKGVKIGVPKEFLGEGVNRDIAGFVRLAAEKLANEGAHVEDCTIPVSEYALPVYLVLSRAEASTNLARYDGVRYGKREQRGALNEMYIATRTNGFGAEVKRRILLGTFVLSSGYADRYYHKAATLRTEICSAYAKLFDRYDALLFPTAPEVAFKIGEKMDDPLKMYMSDTLTVQANVAGLPAISIPVGKVNGLPVGVQVMAPSMREDVCFRVGAVIERSH